MILTTAADPRQSHNAGFACILELLAEPFYILSQNLLLLKLRLVIETAATVMRCLTTYTLIVNQTNMVIVDPFLYFNCLYKLLIFC